MIKGGINEFECPTCGVTHIRCEAPDCEGWAEYEGWQKRGVMNVRVQVCKECLPTLIGFQSRAREHSLQGTQLIAAVVSDLEQEELLVGCGG